MKRTAMALALSVASVVATSQTNPDATPTFHASTHLVQIRAIVRDKDGPVSGLTKDDFILLDRGKPQEIKVFSPEPATPRIDTASASPNTFSDAPQYGANVPSSINIVLLDNLNTLYGSSPAPYESTPYWLEDLALANAKAHLIQFIAGLNPGDRVAIYGLSDSLHVLCDFTSDREELLAILKKFDPRSRTSRATVEPGFFQTPAGPEFNGNLNDEAQRLASMANANRARITMGALISIAGHVAQVPGSKNLVWLTSNLPFSGNEMARILAPAQIAAYMVDARGLLTRGLGNMDSMDGDVAARGDFAPAQSPQPIGIGTMRELAAATGGKAFVNTNDLTGAIREAIEGSAANYTLGFYVDPASLDGKFHELKLRVRRSGMTVRCPTGYFALEERNPSETQHRDRLMAAAQSPLESSAIVVQAKLARVNEPAPNSFKILSSIDIHNLQLVQEGELHKGAISIYLIEQDQTGKIVHESNQALNLKLNEKEYTDYLRTGILFNKYVRPEPGVTTLRLLVQDRSSAAIGSLIIPLAKVK